LVGDCCPADLPVAFEDEWLESCPGKIEGRDQAVVTSPDNYDVSAVGHSDSKLFSSVGKLASA
jgi:hypothetical protein